MRKVAATGTPLKVGEHSIGGRKKRLERAWPWPWPIRWLLGLILGFNAPPSCSSAAASESTATAPHTHTQPTVNTAVVAFRRRRGLDNVDDVDDDVAVEVNLRATPLLVKPLILQIAFIFFLFFILFVNCSFLGRRKQSKCT